MAVWLGKIAQSWFKSGYSSGGDHQTVERFTSQSQTNNMNLRTHIRILLIKISVFKRRSEDSLASLIDPQ